MDYERLTDYEGIIRHLEAYQKGGEHRRWDDYAEKIPVAVREQWKLILSECARQGFITPYVFEGKLLWRRVMTWGNSTHDLCTLCRRECQKRTDIDTGETKWRRQNVNNYHEPAKCWQSTAGART